MNDYFNHEKNIVAPGTRALDTQINNIGDEVAAGFDKLPDLQDVYNGLVQYGAVSGTGDNYQVTLSEIEPDYWVPGTPYVDGLYFCFTVPRINEGPVTVNLNDSGARTVCNPDGTPIVAGSFPAGTKLCVIYEVITDKFILITNSNTDMFGPSITVSDEGTPLTTRVESIDVAGSRVTVTGEKNITISVAALPPPEVSLDLHIVLTPEDFIATSQLTSTGSGSYFVDWGDGNPIEYTSSFIGEVPTGDIIITDDGANTRTGFALNTNTYTGMEIIGLGGITSFADLCKNNSKLTTFECVADCSAITTCNEAWEGCSGLTSFPELDLSGATDFTDAWRNCTGLTSFPLLDLSSGTLFSDCWRDCQNIAGQFPAILFPSAINMTRTFWNCFDLTGDFPAQDIFTATQLAITNVTNMYTNATGLTGFTATDVPDQLTSLPGVWQNTALASFPSGFDLNNVTSVNGAWALCPLTSFPLIDFSGVDNLFGAWSGCTVLTSFPLIITSAVTDFSNTWSACTGITSFPLFDFSAGETFTSTFEGDTSWVGKSPAFDFSAGITFNSTFKGCTGLQQVSDINSPLGTDFTDMFRDSSSITCLEGIDTSNTISSNPFMFTGASSISQPDSGDRNSIDSSSGLDWTNAGSCP